MNRIIEVIQTSILDNKIITCGRHTYREDIFERLIAEGWKSTYNGVYQDDGEHFTIIQKCEN